MEKREIIIEETPVAVWALSDQGDLSDFALKVMQGVLPLLNDYFDLPCPTPKLDLVSIPDFAMGAMENWGAIFFRDSLLLLDEKCASTITQRAAANVITHEIIHQWFGNLVTMHWWDDLWLNESFATWLACKIVDQWRPEWRSWLAFQQEKEVPLSLDALNSTRPIHSNVSSPAEIEEMFDALTYEKGAACLRMIEQFIGESAFRQGIRQYVKKHQYKNARAESLWEELTIASGKPLSETARDWFNQAGFPLIHLKSENTDRSQITLTQNRFFAGKGEKLAERPLWSIPINIRYADSEGAHSYPVLLKDQVSHFSLPSKGTVKWIYGNSGENGFFRIHHDGPLIQEIQKVLSTELAPVERIGFLGDLWALTRQGTLPISLFMETLSLFEGDSTRVVLEEICHYLEILSNQLISEKERPLFFIFVKRLLRPAWDVLGWDTYPEADDENRLARAALLWTLGAVAQDEEILSELPRRQRLYLTKPTSIDPTLASPLIRLCARTDGGTRFDQYIDRFKKSRTPEERDRYLLALSDFGKPKLAEKVMAFALSADVRSQDVWKPVRSLLANQMVQAEAWNFLKTHWVEFLEKSGSLGGQRMIQATRNLWSTAWHDEVKTFFNRGENKVDAAKRALSQTLEFIELGVQFKKSQTEALSIWLSENAGTE
ncbi:MAG: M1 family metallopeptidase [Nitrospiria bacterium]